jgi:hypothetical protein
MHTPASRTTSAALLGAAFLAATPAFAATGVWNAVADPSNGFGGLTAAYSITTPGTAAAEWNVFNGYPLDTSPDVLSFGPSGQSVQELSGAAFLTSGGNIYSFAAATSFAATLTAGPATTGATRDIALRIGLQGTSLDPASVLLDGLAPTISQLLYSETLGGFGGNEEELLYFWEDVADAATYNFSFASASHSMSLDQLAMYAAPTAVVPLPAAGWLLLSGMGTLAAFRKSRHARVTA